MTETGLWQRMKEAFVQLSFLLCPFSKRHSTTSIPQPVRVLTSVSVLVYLAACGSQVTLDDSRPIVHKVYFSGVSRVSEKELRSKILIENQSWNPLYKNENVIDHPFAMDMDKERIEAFYRDHGYFHTKVISASTKPYQGNRVVDVYFQIEEGDPMKVSEVNLIHLEKLLDEERGRIRSTLRITSGQILERSAYMEQKEEWEEYFRKQGYPFADVKLQVRVNRNLNQAEINFELKPGQKMVFGRTLVKGALQTKPADVAMYAALTPNETYSPEKIDIARSKLYNIGVFSSIKLTPVRNPIHPDVVDTSIEVAEGKMKEAQVGVGLGIESRLTEVYAKGGYTQMNFLGGLRTLKVLGEVGYAASPAFWDTQLPDTTFRQGPIGRLELQFVQPDVLGRNSEFRWNAGYHVGLTYGYQYHGPGFNTGFEQTLWNGKLRLSVSYHFQWLHFFYTDTTILASDPAVAGSMFGYEDPYRLGYFQQNVILDMRKGPSDAFNGLYVNVLAEESGIYAGSAFSYQKLVPEARAYLSFGGRVTVAARLMFGQIFSSGSTPITQRFFLGGPNSHRGFNVNRLSPQIQNQNDGTRVPMGGDQMLLLQAEVRVNVAKIFGNWLSVVSFLDGGDVTLSQCSVCGTIDYEPQLTLSQLHWAAGLGVRYKTLIGTLRFDIGVRLNRVNDPMANSPDPGSWFAYHISIGEAF